MRPFGGFIQPGILIEPLSRLMSSLGHIKALTRCIQSPKIQTTCFRFVKHVHMSLKPIVLQSTAGAQDVRKGQTVTVVTHSDNKRAFNHCGHSDALSLLTVLLYCQTSCHIFLAGLSNLSVMDRSRLLAGTHRNMRRRDVTPGSGP